MAQPLSVKTVVVPKGQNKYGSDVVRFTADYLASDLYDMCIGCYPPCHSNLSDIIVLSDDTTLSGRTTPIEDGFHKIDLRKATSGISANGKPVGKQESLLDKLGTSTTVVAPATRYWDV